MIYRLHCVVNAVGVPFNDTFRDTAEEAWGAHWWRDVPKDGDHPNSCLGETKERHEESLRKNGDRVIKVRVETNEIVNWSEES